MSYKRETEPTQIRKGEQIAWTRSFADYPATEYTLEYRFRGQPGVGINVTATANGVDYDAVITTALSNAFGATGRFEWQAWLTEIADTTNTFVVASGRVTVLVGFASGSTAAVDMRSTAKQILDALNAAITNRASATHLEYEISTPVGSRKIKNMTYQELTTARSYWAGIVARENAAERVRNGGSFGKRVDIVVRES